MAESQAAVAKHPEGSPPFPGFCFVKTEELCWVVSEEGLGGGEMEAAGVENQGASPRKAWEVGMAPWGTLQGIAIQDPTCNTGSQPWQRCR